MSYLKENGISFEIIPGVTSAIAAPAYEGIPLTHRELSRSVAFVTGTLKKGEVHLEIPVADTLVFLMAVTNLKEIVDHIIRLDRYQTTTPAAIIGNGTYFNQESILSTVGNIVSDYENKTIKTPAMLIIGEVVSCTRQFKWRSSLPLNNQRVVILRPKIKQKIISMHLLH